MSGAPPVRVPARVPWARRAFAFPIVLYRRFVSPLKPPTCRFHPTCSAYAIEAVQDHGVVRGTYLTTVRLAKCHPFHPGGLDPVPPTSERRGQAPPSSPRTVTGPAPEEL